tara:strand:- start:557 stop:1006 length:450 start_codon:yes stop_codon:yes gene_type:complete
MATKKPEKMRTRPSKYDPLYIKKVDEYLETCKDTVKTFHKTRGEKSDSYDRILQVNIPTKEGFADFIGKTMSSIWCWEEEYPDFGKAVQKILRVQKDRLIKKSLSGEYNPRMSEFLLNVNHGMKAQSELKVTHETLTEEQKKRLDSFLK